MRILPTTILLLIVSDPALAEWWIVRSSDETCLVVDIEPTPGEKGVTRLGKESYPTAADAEADLKRICPDAKAGSSG